MLFRVVRVFTLVLLLLAAGARPASAQWYAAGYLGLNETFPSDVHVDRGPNTSLTFEQVQFEARPMEAPPFFGYRVGRLLRKDRRFGVEFEFLHAKAIAITDAPYHITGTANGQKIDVTAGMNTLVDQYELGLNFLFGNVVARLPLGDSRFTFAARGGAGATRPYSETSLGGARQAQYQWGGFGAQGAAEIDGRVFGRLSAFGEYKVTYAKPTIALAGGTGQMTAVGQQLTFGLAFGWTR